MEVNTPNPIAVSGVPFCFLVNGSSGTPTVTATGADGPAQITPQSDGSYLVCVTPATGSQVLVVHVNDGATFHRFNRICASN